MRRGMTRHVTQLFDLHGKPALVTGGSPGLGFQMTQDIRSGHRMREIRLTAPGPVWPADSRTRQGWLYLAVVVSVLLKHA